MLLFVGIYFYF